MKNIRNSMAELLKESGFDKVSNDSATPALREVEDLQELCLVASYLCDTLSYYVSKNGLTPGAEDVETSNVPDKS